MPLKSKAYPFPVLQPDFRTFGEEDNFDVEFSLSCIQDESTARLVLLSKVELRNDGIEQLVKQGDAGIYVEIYCPATYQRSVLEIGFGEKELDLSELDLANNVEFTGVVLANKPLTKYLPTNVVNEFKDIDTGFEIMKSDVLAYGYTEDKDVTMDQHSKPNLLMVQVLEDVDNHYMDFVVNHPVLKIQLSEKMMAYWNRFAHDAKLKSSVFTNVYRDCIREAVREIKSMLESGEPLEFQWALTLRREIERQSLDINSLEPEFIANALLYQKGFAKTLEMAEKDER